MKYTKHSGNTLLRLVYLFSEQTLESTSKMFSAAFLRLFARNVNILKDSFTLIVNNLLILEIQMA